MPRPDYPFSDQVGGADKRHHIIPWAVLVDLVKSYALVKSHEDTEERLAEFFRSMRKEDLRDANLGSFGATGADKQLDGEDGLIRKIWAGDSEARECLEALTAWTQGNLVVGPAARPNHPDPGEAFDEFACERRAADNRAYEGLQAKWDDKKPERWHILLDLLGRPLLDDTANRNLW